ncbi:hypothetical protein [Chromobacterium vaccinii]|uniref:hypothetical protein n=1 Tax=Chromobacterium vaccinii TaxID=1108595 RepID=UPI0011C02A3F|nr:hypothetical protein [Chromobacterium vaccinii]
MVTEVSGAGDRQTIVKQGVSDRVRPAQVHSGLVHAPGIKPGKARIREYFPHQYPAQSPSLPPSFHKITLKYKNQSKH